MLLKFNSEIHIGNCFNKKISVVIYTVVIVLIKRSVLCLQHLVCVYWYLNSEADLLKMSNSNSVVLQCYVNWRRALKRKCHHKNFKKVRHKNRKKMFLVVLVKYVHSPGKIPMFCDRGSFYKQKKKLSLWQIKILWEITCLI